MQSTEYYKHVRLPHHFQRLTYIEFLQQLSKQAPIVNPGQTPVYSNMAFQLLGYIIERCTGHSFKSVLRQQILDPLELNETSVFAPLNTQNAVIPANQNASGWSAHLPRTEAWVSFSYLQLGQPP
jgi:CubicO group peptidase (beta-lactamase class C family)